jgi:hypothetical protein
MDTAVMHLLAEVGGCDKEVCRQIVLANQRIINKNNRLDTSKDQVLAYFHCDALDPEYSD